MAAEKPPAFQFYPKDFLSSDAVSLMTTEQIGAYMLLLCHSWLRPEGLPADTESLARLARVPAARFTSKVWPGISRSFTANEHGLLCNPRMERGRHEQETYRAERSQSGKRGAASRWADKNDGSGNDSDIAQPIAKNGSSSATALEDPPNPPFNGGRVTKRDLDKAAELRRKSFGRCPHDVEHTYDECLRQIVLEQRAKVSA